MDSASLTFNQKRVIVGIAGGVALLCLANYLFEWSLFGPLPPKKVFIVSMVIAALVVHYLGPTLSEITAYRDAKRNSR